MIRIESRGELRPSTLITWLGLYSWGARALLLGIALLAGLAFSRGDVQSSTISPPTASSTVVATASAISDPAAVSWDSTRTDVFVKGSDNALYHGRYIVGSGWVGWYNRGGSLTSGPGVSSRFPNQLDVFVKGSDGAAWVKSLSGSAWSSWRSLGGQITSDPSAISIASNRVDFFARGADLALWQRTWIQGAGWSGWKSLGGTLDSGLGVSSRGPSQMDIFVRGSDGAIWNKSWNGSSWTGWRSLGGNIEGDPAAVAPAGNRTDLFVRGVDNHLWWKTYVLGQGWTGWRGLGGNLNSGPGVSSRTSSQMDAFVSGTDGAVWARSWNGSSWGSWKSLGTLKPPPPPPPPAVSFIDGTWVVGSQIPAGTYRNSDSSDACYWERLSGFGGTLDEIISNQFTYIRQIVTISASDVGFFSDRCGVWSNNLSPIKSPSAPFGDGMYFVNSEITPGTWRNSDSSGGCYWERLSGFGGYEWIANDFTYSQSIVTISSSDKGFSTDDCGTWTRLY